MTTAYDYAENNADKFVTQLKEWVTIPSVSTDPAYEASVQQAAQWLAADMQRIGLQNVEVLPTKGHPVVYGEYMGAGDDAPTILVYGHYDVQPAAVSDGWDSDPFQPRLEGDKLYGRGATDDKGQVMIQLKAAEAMLATDNCPVNIKYLIEGEEEIGSPNLTDFVEENKDKLSADICLISDTGIIGIDQPSLTYSLRGLLTMELTVTGPKQDLHSGKGGMIHNPAQAAAEIVTKLHHEDGRISIPHFYDDVLDLTDEERTELAKSDISADEWQNMMGDLPEWGEDGYNKIEKVGARPTLEINGISGGYTGAGFKTVLPAKATVKISCRLVANQDPHKIFEHIEAYIADITPDTVRTKLEKIDFGYPALTPLDHPAVQAANRAYARNWDNAPLMTRGGGSIPIVADFQQMLKMPVVLLGFGLPDAGAHGPNESFSLTMYRKGIATVIAYMEEVSN